VFDDDDDYEVLLIKKKKTTTTPIPCRLSKKLSVLSFFLSSSMWAFFSFFSKSLYIIKAVNKAR